MTLEEKNEIMRLASILAMKRVRHYAVSKNVAHFGSETIEGTLKGVIKARRALDEYLKSKL